MVNPETDPLGQARLKVFLFEKLGWTDGRNVRLDIRWANGSAARMHENPLMTHCGHQQPARTLTAAVVLVRIGKRTQPASNEYKEEIHGSSIFSPGFVVSG
jgi:hypothetical protein